MSLLDSPAVAVDPDLTPGDLHRHESRRRIHALSLLMEQIGRAHV